jgi:hypothetical protein
LSLWQPVGLKWLDWHCLKTEPFCDSLFQPIKLTHIRLAVG